MPDITEGRTFWGKAGQRLTGAEVEKRRQSRAFTALMEKSAVAERDAARIAEARRIWAAGQVMPWRITHVLGELDGPEVDRACGVEEPTVDHWELGIVYPTWAQIEALAALTGYPVHYICRIGEEILPSQTSLRFHCSATEIAADDEHFSRRFLPEAIARTLTAEGVLS